MRKIEQQMNDAVANNKNWQSANTSVHFNEENGVSIVRLHGNKIAEIGDDYLQIFDGGWQTTTTKSRLNALIDRFCNAVTDGVFQKDYQWYIRDNKSTQSSVKCVICVMKLPVFVFNYENAQRCLNALYRKRQMLINDRSEGDLFEQMFGTDTPMAEEVYGG